MNTHQDGALAEPHAASHGEAALLLVESLIHGLVAADAITIHEAVDIVEIAVDTKAEQAVDVDMPLMPGSLMILEAIKKSLMHDLRP